MKLQRFRGVRSELTAIFGLEFLEVCVREVTNLGIIELSNESKSRVAWKCGGEALQRAVSREN